MVRRLLDMRRERIKEMDMHHIFYYPPYFSVLIPSRGNVSLTIFLGALHNNAFADWLWQWREGGFGCIRIIR